MSELTTMTKGNFLAPKRMVRMALLISLSAVGAMIKLPSITGTPAFDSAPGYFAAAVFGMAEGAIVGAFGHLLTAMTAGFPLGIPMHLFIAAQMAIYVGAFGWVLNKTNIYLAVPVGIFLNGVVAPAVMIPILGKGFFMAMVLPLLIASALNIIIAALLASLPQLKGYK